MRASVLLLIAMLLAAFTVPAVAQDDGHGHDAAGAVVLGDLDSGLRRRVRDLWGTVVCACPRENWTRTLTNCPDACADPQKEEVLQQVAQGWDDDRVLAYQRSRYGDKAIGAPDDVLTYVLPFLALAGAAMLTVFVLLRWRGGGPDTQMLELADTDASEQELAAIEHELGEID